MKQFVIAVVALALGARAGEATVVAVAPQQVQQEFQGMGCGAIFYEAHVTSLGAAGKLARQEQLYDDMFTRCRTDFLQLMIRPDHEPVNDNDDPFKPAFDEKNFKYCEHDLRICEAAKKRNPAMQFYAVLYTPPAWMKTNHSPSGGGKEKGALKPGLELELAEYAWAFLAHMHRHGQTIQFLSICNEPDWPHTQPGYFLTPSQHAELLAKVGGYLDEMARRFPDVPRVKLVAPNVLSAVDCAKTYLPETLRRAEKFVDVVGCHDYDRRGHRWQALRALCGARPLWMTESSFNGADHSAGLINSAGEFWLAMTEAFNEGVNVWMAYDWVYPPREGGEALIHLNWAKDYRLTKIYHGFQQWCAPLVPGMRVVASGVSGPCASGIAKPGVKASAFASADGRRLVIHLAAVQDTPAEILVKVAAGFENGTAQLWRTSPDEDAAPLPAVAFHDGQWSTTLPARGLLTLVLTKPAITRLAPPEKDFFAKQLLFRGLPIKAPAVVSDEALQAAYERLDGMLRKLPEVADKLARAGVELHIIGRDQVTTDLPEWRHDKGKPLAEYNGLTRDQRTRGMGGKLVSCGEENLLRLEKDRYRGRDICLHEFAHAVRSYGQSPKIRAQFDAQLQASLAAGRWRGAYAGSNPEEFFAELTMWYFGTHGDLAMTGPKPANGPEGLKHYDPEAFVLFDAFYSARLKD